MGGYGSGGWGFLHDKKTTVEECRWVDVGRFKREGMLLEGQTWGGSWWWKDNEGKQVASIDVTSCTEWVRLSYTITYTAGDREPEKIAYTVPVVWTPCNFGGRRPWFVCPGQNCGRRVGKLYFPRYALAKYYLCRHCYDLSYESRQKYDKRVAALRKHPELALAILRSGSRVSSRQALLALKALDGWS